MTRRPCISVALALAVVSAAPMALHAQYRANLRVGISAPAVRADSARVLTARIESKSYWVIGAVATAVPAMIAFQLVVKRGDDPFLAYLVKRVAATAIVGVVFAVPGAVIGSLFPKE